MLASIQTSVVWEKTIKVSCFPDMAYILETLCLRRFCLIQFVCIQASYFIGQWTDWFNDCLSWKYEALKDCFMHNLFVLIPIIDYIFTCAWLLVWKYKNGRSEAGHGSYKSLPIPFIILNYKQFARKKTLPLFLSLYKILPDL